MAPPHTMSPSYVLEDDTVENNMGVQNKVQNESDSDLEGDVEEGDSEDGSGDNMVTSG